MSRIVLACLLALVSAAAMAQPQPQVRGPGGVPKQPPLRKMNVRPFAPVPPVMVVPPPTAAGRAQIAQSLTGAPAPPGLGQTIHLSARTPVVGSASLDFYHAAIVSGQGEQANFVGGQALGDATIVITGAGPNVNYMVVCALSDSTTVQYAAPGGLGGTVTVNAGKASFLLPAMGNGVFVATIQAIGPGGWTLHWCEVSRLA